MRAELSLRLGRGAGCPFDDPTVASILKSEISNLRSKIVE
jgi:hypothetical protein